MPKKTASARGGASRNKPKLQKSIQLVRPDVAVNENDREQDESSEEETTLAAPASNAAVARAATISKSENATVKKTEVESVTSQKEQNVNEAPGAGVGAGKGSAAARLAERRQTALKPQAPRNASLITAEHYSYVRRDLIYILILATIMFSAIIILHFVPAIGG